MVNVTPDADVVARVSLLGGADERPALTPTQVATILQAHPKADQDGLTAEDPSWTPSWSIAAAVAECWSVKAGKVAGDFTFSADGAAFNKGDVMAHCLEMEAHWASQIGGSASTSRYDSRDPLAHRVIVNG